MKGSASNAGFLFVFLLSRQSDAGATIASGKRMSNETENWFYHEVVAAYDEYVAARDRGVSGRLQHRRAALNVATALFHFREHLPPQFTKSRKDVENSCPDYALIGDVANASKHNQLTKGQPAIHNISAVEEISVVTQYVGDGEPYVHAQTFVRVQRDDGSKVWLDPALTTVLNYWSNLLRQLRIADYPARSAPDNSNAKAIPRAEAKALNLEALRVLDFKQIIEMRRFNVATGFPEGCDLSGNALRFSIYKPAYTLDVTMPHPAGDIVVSLDLNQQEAVEFSGLKTDVERESFCQKALASHAREFVTKANDLLTQRQGLEASESSVAADH